METIATKIADFAKANNIDIAIVTMDEIVKGYFEAQEKMYEQIKATAFKALI